MQDVMKESSWDILLRERSTGVTKRLKKVVESVKVKFNECFGKQIRACEYEIDEQDIVSNLAQTEILKQINLVETVDQDILDVGEGIQEPKNQSNLKNLRYVKLNHSKNQIIGDKNKGVMTRRRLAAKEIYLISKIEPKDVVEACTWMRIG